MIKSIQTDSFHLLGVMKLRICSEGHAQLKPQLAFRSSITLNSYAREASSTLDVQEYVDKMSSLDYYSTQAHSCWRVQNGTPFCPGEQKCLHFWMTLPKMLIFEPEPQSKYANAINANGMVIFLVEIILL